MSTTSHPPTAPDHHWSRLVVTETWAAISICAMWLAVAVSAIWGPDFVSSTPGGSSTTIPSAIAVAVFATVGTWAVAKYGLGRSREQD